VQLNEVLPAAATGYWWKWTAVDGPGLPQTFHPGSGLALLQAGIPDGFEIHAQIAYGTPSDIGAWSNDKTVNS
jgi:hypothetical protein